MFAAFARHATRAALAAALAAASAQAGEGRFRIPGDGSVADTATGLVWQQADDGVLRNWRDALRYCQDLAVAGRTDWRAPHIKELLTLNDGTRTAPAMDPVAFPTAKSIGYWTGTTRAGSPNFAWYVLFGNASVYTSWKTDKVLIRCVR